MAEGADDDDKTEDPTERKLEEAMKKGDVARSQEIGTFFVLSGLTLAIMIGSGTAMMQAALSLRAFLMNAHQVSSDAAGFNAVTVKGLSAGFYAMGLPLGFILAAALVGALVQHKPLWTTEPLMPKANRVSPLAGFKRVFGKEALVNFVKGVLKLIIVGAVAAVVLWLERDRMESFARMEVVALLPAAGTLALKLMGGVLAIYAFFAVGDFAYQRYTWYQRQRMTLQEIKDEQKNSEGNPEVKAKLRQLRARQLRRRMMANVPKATVVVTNPTHYAVALRYETGMAAPVCVAKGVDALALKIREVAGEHEVPVVESPPLARALYASVEIDDEIPLEHYQAVAELIGYVMKLNRRRA